MLALWSQKSFLIKNDSNGSHYAPSEFNISLHGETYHIKVKGSGDSGETERPFYVSVDGISEEVLIETLDELQVNTVENPSTDKKNKSTESATDNLRPKTKS